MPVRVPEDRLPEDQEPWESREFLHWAYHERGLSPRMIADELGVETSRVTVHMERLGVLRPWRHEPTLRRLYVDEGLAADAIAARNEFDCSPVTIRKYLAEYGLIDIDPADIGYGRLDDLGSESQRETRPPLSRRH